MVFKKFKVNNFFKIIQLIFIFTFPVITLANHIKGSGWFAIEEDGDKKIILLEKDGSFTYLNVVSQSGNEGNVYSDNRDTWKEDNNNLILSFTDGFKICSLKSFDWSEEIMSGTCINKNGLVETMQLRQIK